MGVLGLGQRAVLLAHSAHDRTPERDSGMAMLGFAQATVRVLDCCTYFPSTTSNSKPVKARLGAFVMPGGFFLCFDGEAVKWRSVVDGTDEGVALTPKSAAITTSANTSKAFLVTLIARGERLRRYGRQVVLL